MSIPDTGLLSYDLFFDVMKKYFIKREKPQMVSGGGDIWNSVNNFLKKEWGKPLYLAMKLVT